MVSFHPLYCFLPFCNFLSINFPYVTPLVLISLPVYCLFSLPIVPFIITLVPALRFSPLYFSSSLSHFSFVLLLSFLLPSTSPGFKCTSVQGLRTGHIYTQLSNKSSCVFNARLREINKKLSFVCSFFFILGLFFLQSQ